MELSVEQMSLKYKFCCIWPNVNTLGWLHLIENVLIKLTGKKILPHEYNILP